MAREYWPRQILVRDDPAHALGDEHDADGGEDTGFRSFSTTDRRGREVGKGRRCVRASEDTLRLSQYLADSVRGDVRIGSVCLVAGAMADGGDEGGADAGGISNGPLMSRMEKLDQR